MKRKGGDEKEREKPNVKFVRTFAHVDGNWPSFVYISVQRQHAPNFSRLAKACLRDYLRQKSVAGELLSSSSIVVEDAPHISLSKPFILRSHQIEPFLQKLGSAMESLQRLVSVSSLYSSQISPPPSTITITITITNKPEIASS